MLLFKKSMISLKNSNNNESFSSMTKYNLYSCYVILPLFVGVNTGIGN